MRGSVARMNKILPAVFPLFVYCETPQEPRQCEPTEVVRVVEKIVPAECQELTAAQPAHPSEFGPDDKYETIKLACRGETDGLESKYRRPVLQYCLRRAWHGSRDGKYCSKVDGSYLHDRDRPWAIRQYKAALRRFWVDPIECVSHQLDPDAVRPAKSFALAKNWPFKRPAKLPLSRKRKWLKSPPDVQRFGTRGPIDMVPAYHGRFLTDKCFDPAWFDRNDIAARSLVHRAMYIFSRAPDERPTKGYLIRNWRLN